MELCICGLVSAFTHLFEKSCFKGVEKSSCNKPDSVSVNGPKNDHEFAVLIRMLKDMYWNLCLYPSMHSHTHAHTPKLLLNTVRQISVFYLTYFSPCIYLTVFRLFPWVHLSIQTSSDCICMCGGCTVPYWRGGVRPPPAPALMLADTRCPCPGCHNTGVDRGSLMPGPPLPSAAIM